MADTKAATPRTAAMSPRYSVGEGRDGKIRIMMEMPGVRKENLDISMENNRLRILGRRDTPAGARYVLRERRPGDFMQSFTLDETIDQTRVDAALANGVLTVTLDLKEQVKPRTIKVRAG
jgi:HSP20 family protein